MIPALLATFCLWMMLDSVIAPRHLRLLFWVMSLFIAGVILLLGIGAPVLASLFGVTGAIFFLSIAGLALVVGCAYVLDELERAGA